MRTDFRNIFRYRNNYFQIRYIDLLGMERCRIDISNIDDVKCPKNLQDKSKRYYFKESIIMKKNQIYISRFDLNIEHEKIELPFKLTLRVATTIWDKKNNKKGILIINYLGEILLNDLKVISKLSKSKIMLLNKESYSFTGMGKDKNWGFMFKDKKDNKFLNLYPKEWKLIDKSDHSQFLSENGLFTSQKVYFSKNDKSKYWVLVSYILSDDILDKNLVRNFIIILVFLVFISFLISFLIALIIIKKRIYFQKVYHSANYDLLTSLPNRSLFHDRLNQVYNHSFRYKDKFALLFIDLDGFKAVNDTYGHDSGDCVLKITADRLNSLVRSSDTVARLGGDEFTIILLNIDNKNNVENIAKKIISKLSETIDLGKASINIGASIGIYIYDASEDISSNEIIQKSDKAMYIAKNSGKNRYHFSEE